MDFCPLRFTALHTIITSVGFMSHRLSGGFIRYKHDTFQQTFGCEIFNL